MLLIDRHILRRAIHFTGGCMHHAPRSKITRRHQHIERAHNIHVDHFARIHIRIRDRDQRAEMKDRVHTADSIAHRFVIAQVALHDLHLRKNFRCEPLQHAEVIARVVAHKAAHLRTFTHQMFHQMAGDKSACAGDQNFFTVPIHFDSTLTRSRQSLSKSVKDSFREMRGFQPAAFCTFWKLPTCTGTSFF